MKKMLAMMLTLAMLATGAFALADTVTVGTNAAFEPFEYIGDDGNPTGFDMEIAQLIAADLGKALVIEDMYFDGLLPALDVGTIDFLASAMTITPERKEGALFSDPYFNATQAVVVLADYEGIQSVEDIADKKIAAQDGTTGFMMATDELGVDPANVSAFKASTDTVLELTSGRVDCIIIDDAVAQSFLKAFDGLKIVDGLEMPVEEYGMAVKMGNQELVDAINAKLAKIKEDGSYDELIAKYFE